jgi:hypothetical protein
MTRLYAVMPAEYPEDRRAILGLVARCRPTRPARADRSPSDWSSAPTRGTTANPRVSQSRLRPAMNGERERWERAVRLANGLRRWAWLVASAAALFATALLYGATRDARGTLISFPLTYVIVFVTIRWAASREGRQAADWLARWYPSTPRTPGGDDGPW